MSHATPGARADHSRTPAGERRAWVRQACYWLVSVFTPFPMGSPQKRWPAVMRDLSRTGVGLLLSQPLDLETLLIVDLQDSSGAFSVSRMSQVVYLRENPEALRSKRWQVGCEFRGSHPPPVPAWP